CRHHVARGKVLHGLFDMTVHTSPQKRATTMDVAPRRSGRDLQDVLNLLDNGDAFPFELQKDAVPLDSSRQFLVITTNALKSAFTPLLTHRASAAGGGFTTYIATVEDISSSQSGRDLAEKIRNFIKSCYTNYGTQFVVLGGDADGLQASQAVPTRGCKASVGSYTDNYIPTDYYYACLDGTWDNDNDNIFGESNDGVGGGDIDWLAEVAVGRIPADSTQAVQYAINKIIAYDTAAAPFKALLVGENLDSTPTWGGDKLDYIYQAMNAMPRDALYDRDVPGRNWSKSELISLLSSNNYSLVFHLGHLDVTYNMKMSNSDLDGITNTKYQFVYSQGCYSNSYDGRTTTVGSYSSSDSIGEDFLVRNANNAFGYIGNSRYGWYYPGQSFDGASNLVHRRFAEAVFQSSIRRREPGACVFHAGRYVCLGE
ncbi:MAG: C25 family cysteine peptidase, partial [Desulfovibrio sp.]|nr:C25 family cysteine peptidase [Desulfovibrio sp.]